VEKVLNLYFDDAPRQILAMRNALAAGDGKALKRAAHTLKSNSANVGALQLAQSCQTMELRAGTAKFDDAEDSICYIESQYARVRAALSDCPTTAPA
jgi:HPt (histidine-containing phosphotransfer) domain-containing protein